MSGDQEFSSRLKQVEQEMLSVVAKLEGDYDRELLTEELAEVLCFLAKYKVRLLEIEGHSYPYASLGNMSIHIPGRDFAKIFRKSECIEQQSSYFGPMTVLIARVSTWSVVAALTVEELSQC